MTEMAGRDCDSDKDTITCWQYKSRDSRWGNQAYHVYSNVYGTSNLRAWVKLRGVCHVKG